MFTGLGYSTFVFDYRGYGQSEGKTDEQGTYHDAEAAWEWLLRERHFAPQDVIILGRSLGAAISSWLARKHQAAAVVLESTFTSLPDIAAETHRLIPARLMTRFDYNTLDNVRQIHSPIMIIHSRDDIVIPYHHGQRLFAAANEPKTFLAIHGNHAEGFLHSGQHYIDGLRAFLDQHVH
jgi:pimeloyl-ACP methyl ester carboxylesterase